MSPTFTVITIAFNFHADESVTVCILTVCQKHGDNVMGSGTDLCVQDTVRHQTWDTTGLEALSLPVDRAACQTCSLVP